jgi:hypothetical protein
VFLAFPPPPSPPIVRPQPALQAGGRGDALLGMVNSDLLLLLLPGRALFSLGWGALLSPNFVLKCCYWPPTGLTITSALASFWLVSTSTPQLQHPPARSPSHCLSLPAS